MFKESVDSIVAWMEVQQTGPDLVGLIQSYLIARGTKTAVSLLHSDSPLWMAASFHDLLGWDNFVEIGENMCPLGGNVSSRNPYSRTDKGGRLLGTRPYATPT